MPIADFEVAKPRAAITSVIVSVSAVIPHGTAPGIIDFGEKNFGNASSFTMIPLLSVADWFWYDYVSLLAACWRA
ncbi:hypothetical protein NUKP40_09420 [Klebsiella variicola]|jgi:hypothetical protein|nr:hypothetical protein NUKP40_09420 [Klebsiella variicola]